MAKSLEFPTYIPATTGITAALYEGGGTLYIFSGLGFEDKENDSSYPHCSKYDPPITER